MNFPDPMTAMVAACVLPAAMTTYTIWAMYLSATCGLSHKT